MLRINDIATRPRKPAGFTLLELSIVLTIIAVIVAGTLSMGGSMVDSAKRSNTNNKLNQIEAALAAYRQAYNRLPCPGDATMLPANANYGYEVGTAGTCAGNATANIPSLTTPLTTVAEGALPVKTLGLPAEFMYDAWGRKFGYAVWTPMTAADGFSLHPLLCNRGAITVQDAGYGPRSTAAIYAIISYGPDGHGGYTTNGGATRYNAGSDNADEITNAHYSSAGANQPYTATYVQHEWTKSPTDPKNIYDDQVRFRERWQMQNAFDASQPNGLPCGYGPCLWVVDEYNDQVQQFNYSGGYISTFGSSCPLGSGSSCQNGGFVDPEGIAIDNSGNIWVSDYTNYRVQKFNSCGAYLSQIGSAGSADGQFNWPEGIAIDSKGNIWIVEKLNSRVQKFDSTGNWLMTIPATNDPKTGCNISPNTYPTSACPGGNANGIFTNPYGIAVDSKDDIWVVDTYNSRVQEFNSSGTWMASLGGTVGACKACLCTSITSDCPAQSGSGNGQFHEPFGIAIDNKGNIWVADSRNNRIQKFDSNGNYLSQFGATDFGNKQFDYPENIAIDQLGNIWVTDENNRVWEYNINVNGTVTNVNNIPPASAGVCANHPNSYPLHTPDCQYGTQGLFQGPTGMAFH